MNKKLLGLVGGMLLASSVFIPVHGQAAAVADNSAIVNQAKSVDVNDPTGFVVLSDVRGGIWKRTYMM